MIDIAAAVIRWILLLGNMTLVGGCMFLAIAAQDRNALASPWVARLEKTLPWLAVIVMIGLIGVLSTTTALATGITENAWNFAAWQGILEGTRMGQIWLVRTTFAFILLGITLYVRNTPRAQWRYILCAICAALVLIAGALASHSAAEEFSFVSIFPYALHIILASVWFGALPAFLLVLFTTKKEQAQNTTVDGIIDVSGVETLKRFSKMALPVMGAIFATGIYISYRMIDTSYAALIATKYGWLLNGKIALLLLALAIAARARSTWLPLLLKGADMAVTGGKELRKWVPVELLLATLVVLLATIVANTLPAKHALIQDWPYSFRFSIDATWEDPTVMARVWAGVTLVVLAIGAAFLGWKKGWDNKRLVGVPGSLLIGALAAGLPPLAIPAYPETYRKTPVPFDTISISNGSALYAENCVPCHGPQGKGDGVLAKTFPKPPVDMLTEPHTAKHTAGDFFSWLTSGIPGTPMPVFGMKLSEEERWDIVNFLHAMSRGYQARLMSPQVVPNQPTLGPPNFAYSAHDGTSGILKDFRQQKAVLIVLFTWPESRARINQLKQIKGSLGRSDIAILAVPMNDPGPEDLAEITSGNPFPVVTQGATEIMNSYALFRRTLDNPDLLGPGTIPKHMEFLVDRFGYLRARWIPEADKTSWTDMTFLLKQAEQLKQEKEIKPPPGDHVH